MTLVTPHIETPVAGLHASAPEALPFARSLHIRAFLLQRPAGNALIYSTTGIRVDDFAEAGGIARAYLNHRHEAGFGHDLPGVPLFVHGADRDAVAGKRKVRGAFSQRHVLDSDLEVIPTPGHTPGATAYCGTTASTGSCSPATRSTCATANGWPPCSTPAIAARTSRAWS